MGAEHATATRAAPEAPEREAPARRQPAGAGSGAFRLALHVNEPGDEWEREAERAADRFVLGHAAAGSPPPPPLRRTDADANRAGLLPGAGRTLPAAARADFQRGLAADFSGVRVHTDDAAAEAARSIDARAFTHGPHIAFAPGEYDPVSSAGRRLLAHELTHVVQQRAAPGRAPAIQRQEKKNDSLLDKAAGYLHKGEAAVKSGFVAVVRRIAPGLADIVEQGPVAYLKGRISGALESWVSGLTGGIDVLAAIDGVHTSIRKAWDTVSKLLRGGADACHAVVDILGALRNLADAFFDNPAIETVKTVIGKVSDVVESFVKVVGAPIFDALKDVLGTAWDTIKKIGSTIWSWVGAVKNAASWAWDEVSKALGLSGDNEDGIWAWIKKHALSIWDDVKKAIAPALGPLKTVGKVLVALTPMGEIYILVKYGPKVVDAVKWLWQHGFDADAAAKDPAVNKTILPQLISTAKGFGASIEDAALWVMEKAQSLVTAGLELGGRITGLPLLGAAKSLVTSLTDGARKLLDWGRNVLKSAADGVKNAVHKVMEVVEPWKEVISSVILAIVDPPMIPVILAGWAWRKLSSCVKRALIDFILDIVVNALRSMVDLPFLGPLWPLLKAGVIGFLDRLRHMTDDVKEAVSNKVAKIISGASPAFMLAFVKGFLSGIWSGISDPISLLWSILDGIVGAVDAIGNAASRFLAPATPVTAVAAAPVTAAPATAPSAKPDATPVPASASAAAPANDDRGSVSALLMQMVTDLAAPFADVTKNFWSAVSDYFSSTPGVTFGDLIDKLGNAWSSLKSSIETAGGKLADLLVGFLQRDDAEDKMGDAVGSATGQFAFQALLDFLTAGTWEVADETIMALKPVITVIAKVINWPMEVMGEAMSLLKKLGSFVVDGIKGLAGMAKEAAAGAFKTVVEAIRTIGDKLVQWGERIAAKLGGGVAHEGEAALEKEALGAETKAIESDVAKSVETSGAEKTEQQIAEDAQRKAEQDAAKDEESAAQKEEQKAAQHEAAEEAAEGVVTESDFEDDALATTLVKLYAVQLAFPWIENFEMEEEAGEEIYYMRASKTRIGRRAKRGRRVPATAGPARDVVDRLEARYESVFARRDDLLARLDEIEALAKDPSRAADALSLAEQLERDAQRAAEVGEDVDEAGKAASNLEGARDTGDTTRPRTSRHSPERVLEADMERSGMPRPDAYHEPHHIVPKRSMGGSELEDIPSAERARDILKNEGIDVNSAANGVWLPRTSIDVSPEAFSRHATIHTKRYYDELARRLERAAELDDVPGELARIRQLIADGLFPH